MPDDKLFELMEKMYSEMQEIKEGIKELKDSKVNLKACLKDLKYGQMRIEKKLVDIETSNANSHLEIEEQLEDLSRDLNMIEAISGKNLADIAYLKFERKRKVK